VIGIFARFSFSPSQRVNALIPSSTVLFLTTVASTLPEAFRLVSKISEELAPFDGSARRLSNMKLDYSNLLPAICSDEVIKVLHVKAFPDYMVVRKKFERLVVLPTIF
jgi:NMD protein affecting ribosome stability and mRNA decay